MWAKSLAAALLGLPLTVGMIGLVVLLWPGELDRITMPWLLMSFPVWVGVMSLAFLAKTGLRAWLCMALATVAAIAALGLWAGVFAALTALMLVLVVLPYLDAWLQLRKGRRHVG